MNTIDLSLFENLKEKDLGAKGLMVLEGRIVIEKALERGIAPDILVCTEIEKDFWEKRRAEIFAKNFEQNTEAFAVIALPHDELCRLVNFKFHRGALAIATLPDIPAFSEWMASPAFSCRDFQSFLCVWDVTDPSNLGALIRTAAGLGMDAVLLGPGCASPYYRKAIRASMGNVFSIPLYRIDEAGISAIDRNISVLVAAALSEQALTIDAFQRLLAMFRETRQYSNVILILGNEGYGIPSHLLEQCQLKVCIPMERGVDSLNVAVAGGIFMYAMRKS